MLANNLNGEANIETLPQYIFVFEHEVFNKINGVFRWRYTRNPCPRRYAPKYPLGKCLYLPPENDSTTHSEQNKNRTGGHQTISSSCATMLCLLPFLWKKKSDVSYAAFRAQSFFPQPISCTRIQFEPYFMPLISV